jgi:hypothetical protein
MSELKNLLVLVVAVLAFLFAAYMQGGGTWRGPHNLRKSLPAKETKINWRDAYPAALSTQARTPGFWSRTA